MKRQVIIDMLEINKIHCMDCIKGMQSIPDNSIDLILTDPPYGDGVGYGRNNKEIINNDTPLIMLQAIQEIGRILKKDKTAYIFTNWKHYPFIIDFVLTYSNLSVRHLIVWKKGNIGLGFGFRNQYELIIVLEKGRPTYNLNDVSNVQETKVINHDSETHPHEKPVSLLRKLIKHSSKEYELILD